MHITVQLKDEKGNNGMFLFSFLNNNACVCTHAYARYLYNKLIILNIILLKYIDIVKILCYYSFVCYSFFLLQENIF